jgi:hypothetical protein
MSKRDAADIQMTKEFKALHGEMTNPYMQEAKELKNKLRKNAEFKTKRAGIDF